MTWVIIAVVVVAVLFFLILGKKSSTATTALASSGAPTTEDSRRNLESLFSQNRFRVQAMPDGEARELMSALRRDGETHWNHAYETAVSDGKDSKFATQLALFRTAAVAMTGEQQPDRSLYGGLDLETVPFKSLPPKQAKSAFFEYCVAKYAPTLADWGILNPALLKFADEVFENSKAEPKPDHYIYEMIYREMLDWQKFLAKALGERNKH